MKKLLVLADTHMPKFSKDFPKQVIDAIKQVEIIIHVGDFSTYDTYLKLSNYKEVIGVYGNVDDEKLIEYLPKKRMIEIENVRIGLIHGDGKKKTTIKRTQEAFINENVNLIIFGHSHIPIIKYEPDLVLFNPGSPTNKRKEKEYSFGIITIDDQFFSCELIFFPFIDK